MYRQVFRERTKKLDLWVKDLLDGETLKDEMGNIRIWPDKLLELLKLKGKQVRDQKKFDFTTFLLRYPYPPATTHEEANRRVATWHKANGGSIHLNEYLGWTWKQYTFWVRTGEIPRFKKGLS